MLTTEINSNGDIIVRDREAHNRVLGRVSPNEEGNLSFRRNALVLLSESQQEGIDWLMYELGD